MGAILAEDGDPGGPKQLSLYVIVRNMRPVPSSGPRDGLLREGWWVRVEGVLRRRGGAYYMYSWVYK